MQRNSEFIENNLEIFKLLNLAKDKSNVIGSLLSTKTFDFEEVNKET